MNLTTNVFLAGVGGQGIILSAKIIAMAAELAEYEVSTSEIHGMAQRGGSVTAQLRFGKQIISPLILEGTADVLVASEPIEAIRYAHFLKEDGKAIVSSTPLIPVTVSTGNAVYPANVEDLLRRHFYDLTFKDYGAMARDLGNERMSNVLMVGELARETSIPLEIWLKALERCVKPAFLDANKNAFLVTFEGGN